MSYLTREQLTAFSERVKRERVAQGRPPTVEDDGVLDKIAGVVGTAAKPELATHRDGKGRAA